MNSNKTDDLKDEIESLKSENEDLKDYIKDLEDAIKDVEWDTDRLDDSIKKLVNIVR